jgi:hypothetical protein
MRHNRLIKFFRRDWRKVALTVLGVIGFEAVLNPRRVWEWFLFVIDLPSRIDDAKLYAHAIYHARLWPWLYENWIPILSALAILAAVVWFERRRNAGLYATQRKLSDALRDTQNQWTDDLQAIALTYYCFDRKYGEEMRSRIDAYRAAWKNFDRRVNDLNFTDRADMANGAKLVTAAWGVLHQQAERLFSYRWHLAPKFNETLNPPDMLQLPTQQERDLYKDEWRRHQEHEFQIRDLEKWITKLESEALGKVEHQAHLAIKKDYFVRKG